MDKKPQIMNLINLFQLKMKQRKNKYYVSFIFSELM